MRNVIVTGPPRADLDVVDQLAVLGVATVHEAIGRLATSARVCVPSRTGRESAGPRSPRCAGPATTS